MKKEKVETKEEELEPSAMEMINDISSIADDLIEMAYMMGANNQAMSTLKIGSEEWDKGVFDIYRRSVNVRNKQKELIGVIIDKCLVVVPDEKEPKKDNLSPS